MKQKDKVEAPAFIWDLDGTLLDSYAVIVPSLYKTCCEFGIDFDEEEIHKDVISHTVGDFIVKAEQKSGIPGDILIKRYTEIKDSAMLNIKPITNAAEILRFLQKQKVPNFIFTHRGNSTEIVLKNTGLYEYFDEIVTGKDGFPRKPDPSALIYLIRKYNLDKDNTFYVGDRTLDAECAENAGIKSIFYLPMDSPAVPSGRETHVVNDLLQIKEIIRINPTETQDHCIF